MSKYKCLKSLDLYWFEGRYYTPRFYSSHYHYNKHHKVPIFVSPDGSARTTESQGYMYFKEILGMEMIHKIIILKELQKLYKKDIFVTIVDSPINIKDIQVDEKFSKIIYIREDTRISLNEEGKLVKDGSPLLKNVHEVLTRVVKSLYTNDVQILDTICTHDRKLFIAVDKEPYDIPFFNLLRNPDEIEKLDYINLSLHPNFFKDCTKYTMHELRLQYLFSKLDKDFQEKIKDWVFWNE